MFSSSTIRILGMDPGTVNMGFSYIDYDLASNQIIRSDLWSIKTEKLIRNDDDSAFIYGERFIRIQKLKDYILDDLTIYTPNFVFCETPFFNILRPSAFQPLAEVLFAIKTACYEYNPLLEWKGVEPKLVKASIGATGKADKDKVKDCMKILQPSFNCLSLIEHSDEHAIDALAVAYTGLNFLKEKIYVGVI